MAERLKGLASHFNSVPLEPPDAIFGLSAKYKADSSKQKVDLVVGAYRDENGKPWVLPVVRKVEKELLEKSLDHEYLPIDGLSSFTSAASLLLLGPSKVPFTAVQALSGTGALRIGAEFLAKHYKESSTVYLPNPTWGKFIIYYFIFQTNFLFFQFYSKP